MAHNRRGAANKTATTTFTAAAMSTNNIIMGMILAVWILVVGVTATTTTAADTAAGNDAANTRLVRHGSNGHVRHRHLQRFNLTLDDDVNMNDDDDVNTDDDTDDILTTDNDNDDDNNGDDTNIDDRMIDDQGELLDDASTNNGTAEDDDEWYLPESKIPLFDLIQASPFGAGDSQDWGVASIVDVSSSSGTTDDGSANSDTEDDDNDDDDEYDDDDDDDDGETIRKTKVITTIDKIMHNLHSTPVPITTSTSSSSSTSSSLINTFNAATTSTKKDEESTTNTNTNNSSNNIISISAGNIHSVILTRQGIVMTAGSVGLMEEDRGLGRSLDAAVVVVVDVDSTITTSHDDDGVDDDAAATIVEDDKFDTANSTISHDIFKFHPVTQVYIHDSNDDSHTLLTSSSSTTTSNSNSNNNNNNKDDFPTFTKIVTSQYFTYLLDTNGHVYSSGINTHGQLCLNDTISRDRFHQIPSSFFELESDGDYVDNNGGGSGGGVKDGQVPIVDIALGERHALFLREDGVVFACGWNVYGQLGLGVRGVDVWSPRRVIIDEIDGDEDDEDGGMNDNATSATSDKTTSTTKPTIDTQTITHITAGRGSSYFRTTSGHVFSTGTNYEGQLCLGHRDDRTLPTLVLNYGGVQDIIAGKSSLYLLMGDGYVLSCGSNMHGQLGDGGLLDSRDVPLPVIVGGGTAATPDTTIGGGDDDDDFGNATTMDEILRNVTRIFSGPIAFNAFFLTSNGIIYGVGYNGSGQLGVGDRVNRNVATVVACSDTVSNDEKDNNNENDVVWTREVILNKTVISSGNDHTLFLGGEDTFIGCTVDSSSTSKGPTTSPQETTPSPTSSTSPTESHMPSESPTISSAPSTSQMPSGTPTVSSSPTISPMPTPGETDWPTPPLTSVEPTITPAPTLSHVPTAVSSSPTAGAVTSPGGNGSDRSTSGGVGTRLMGECHGGTLIFVMMTCLWQWL